MTHGYLCTRTGRDVLKDMRFFWKRSKGKADMLELGQCAHVQVVTLPFRQEHMTGQNAADIEDSFRRALHRLAEHGVTNIACSAALRKSGLPERFSTECGLRCPDGRRLFALLMPDFIRKAVKELGCDAQSGTLAICTDSPSQAEDIVESAQGMFRYVILVGDDRFFTVSDSLYEKYGLAVRVCDSAFADLAVYNGGMSHHRLHGRMVLDMSGKYPERENVIRNAYVNLETPACSLPGCEEFDLGLAEWYLEALADGGDLAQTARDARCTLAGMVRGSGRAACASDAGLCGE